MSRKSKYSIEQRVQACEDYRNGTRSLEEICIALGTPRKKTIREWLKKYEKYGVSAFQEKSYNKSYTKEFKMQVVEEYISGHGSLEELILKYDISSTIQLRKWISVYNANRELKDYCPKREVYMAEARRKTSIEERKEIVKYCIEHNRNYKETASVYDVSYSQVYSWVKKYDARGEEGLTDKRGHHKTDEEVEGVMKVSFDLDDTLFVSPENFKTEVELKFPFNRIYKEHLRLGTIDLMNWIQEQGIELWVYTTSFRSERYIRALFRCYGIKLDAVVNGERHAREVQADKKEAMPSKYPGKYRIDLHIDDDISVVQNGRVYGFKVFLIGSQDDQWTDKIKQEIKNIIEIKFKGRK